MSRYQRFKAHDSLQARLFGENLRSGIRAKIEYSKQSFTSLEYFVILSSLVVIAFSSLSGLWIHMNLTWLVYSILWLNSSELILLLSILQFCNVLKRLILVLFRFVLISNWANRVGSWRCVIWRENCCAKEKFENKQKFTNFIRFLWCNAWNAWFGLCHSKTCT